jgi:uncharacterized membrane protein YjgN (DUF898 family)
LLVAFVAIVIPAILLWPLAMAIYTRWHIEGFRFGDVAVASSFRVGPCYGLFLKLIFSSLGFLIAFSLLTGLVAFLFDSFVTEAVASMEEFSWTAFSALLLIAMAYLIALLGLGVLQRYFLGRGLWAAIAASTTITNLQAVDAVVAAGQSSGILGEGLADALDFNVGL